MSLFPACEDWGIENRAIAGSFNWPFSVHYWLWYQCHMTTITLDQSDQRLRELIRRSQNGEDIIIADGAGPVAKLVAVESPEPLEPRKPGALKGKLNLPDSFFFDPLPEDELKLWWPDDAAGK